MLRRPKVLTTVVSRHSNRTVTIVDARPPTLSLVTSITTPPATVSSARLPKSRAHVNAERMCLILACTRDPTNDQGSPIWRKRGHHGECCGGGGGGGQVHGKRRKRDTMRCPGSSSGSEAMLVPRRRQTAFETPTPGHQDRRVSGGAQAGGTGWAWRAPSAIKRACHGYGGQERRMHRCMPRAEVRGGVFQRFSCRSMAGDARSTCAAPPPRPQVERQAFTL